MTTHSLMFSFLIILFFSIQINTVSSVKLITKIPGELRLFNDHVNVTLTTGGFISKIQYKSFGNIFNDKPVDPLHPWRQSYGWKKDDRGYYDCVAKNSQTLKRVYEKIGCSSWKIITLSEKRVTLRFSRPFNHSNPNTSVPADIHLFYSLKSDTAGLYTWAIFQYTKSMPPGKLQDFRMVLKLRPQDFNFAAISDDRQREMPEWFDVFDGNSEKTLVPEARNLTNPSNPKFKYEVDHKYHYLLPLKDHGVYGWISNSTSKIGVWAINPHKMEYSPGGPLKQSLTVQTGAILLNSLHSSHLISSSLDLKPGLGWNKTFGPWLIYLNNEKDSNGSLWEDAKKRAIKETIEWPYGWANKGKKETTHYPSKYFRVHVFGQLKIVDLYLNISLVNLSKSWVGLAPPGGPGSWSQITRGYQFWTQPLANGSFKFPHVRKGRYNLFGFFPGVFGELWVQKIIKVINPTPLDLGIVEFRPIRQGPTVWEIGFPDRNSAEFFVPEMNPRSKFPYPSVGPDRFRNYGAWDSYRKAFPGEFGVKFEVGDSSESRDWWYVQPNRIDENGTVKGTIWKVLFHLEKKPLRNSEFILRIGVASSSFAILRVYVNSMEHMPIFDSSLCSCTLGNKDNAMARGASYGIYNMYNIPILWPRLKQGQNIIYLMQRQGVSPFVYLMYDYLRLEGPT